MSYNNGYQNGNGNGNGKAFVLERPKTPEEIKREQILEMMPKLRRDCSRDKRLNGFWVGAKWLFGTLTDLSFLYNYGGNGFGIVLLSVKDLSRIFGHNKDSIAKWRDKLIETGWIWYLDTWPKSQWGIMGVCNQPDLLPMHVDYIRTAAKAAAHPKPSDGVNGEHKTEDLGQNSLNLPPTHPTPSDSSSEGLGQSVPSLRTVCPKPSTTSGLNLGTDHPKASDAVSEGVGHTGRTGHATPSQGLRNLRETPIGDRSNGAIKGKVPPPQSRKAWEKKVEKMYERELRGIRSDLIEQRKGVNDAADYVDLTERIEFVETHLYGAPKKRGGAKAMPKPAEPEKPLTEAELKASKQYVAALRKAVG